jgi:hypothetical protein
VNINQPISFGRNKWEVPNKLLKCARKKEKKEREKGTENRGGGKVFFFKVKCLFPRYSINMHMNIHC